MITLPAIITDLHSRYSIDYPRYCNETLLEDFLLRYPTALPYLQHLAGVLKNYFPDVGEKPGLEIMPQYSDNGLYARISSHWDGSIKEYDVASERFYEEVEKEWGGRIFRVYVQPW